MQVTATSSALGHSSQKRPTAAALHPMTTISSSSSQNKIRKTQKNYKAPNKHFCRPPWAFDSPVFKKYW
jgi:hypothetical protein